MPKKEPRVKKTKKATRVPRGPNSRNPTVSVKKAGRSRQSQRNSGAGWYTPRGQRKA